MTKASALLIVLLWGGCAVAQAAPPNVLVILTDDQGWGDLSLHGNRSLSTPHFDSLGEAGASFERFYVQPVCAPTRAEFLTGRWHRRDGVSGVTSGAERLSPDVETIADAFRAAGYATGCFGKWHNGTQAPYHPNCRGFDEFYGFCSGHWGLYFDPMLDHNGEVVRGQGYLTDDLTDHAIDFVEANAERPLFAFVAYNTPHSPMQVPDRWWDKFAGAGLPQTGSDADREATDHTRAALAMCENLDWNVGRLLQKLEDSGLSENTIVVFFSDNGPNGHRFNGGMRGMKGSVDEGGVRSPLFIRWPNKVPSGTTVTPMAAAIDLAPTLCDLANIAPPNAGDHDGVSLEPLLLGRDEALPDRTLFTHWNGRTAARHAGFVLDNRDRLYNLLGDPGQSRNAADQHPALAEQLRGQKERWLSETGQQHAALPFTVGHPTMPATHLPARDAAGRGVSRSSRHPNCSYFTDWRSTEAEVRWDVDVVEAGTFRVELYYTCPEADVGSLVELRLGDAAVSGRVAPAHDPPITSVEHNRYPAEEGPVKAFRPLDLGVMQLPQGTGTLTLRALEVPGTQVMDFRLLVLTRTK